MVGGSRLVFTLLLSVLALAAGLAEAAERGPWAGLMPSDLRAAGIKGDWSAAAPEFSALMKSDPEAGAYVYSMVFDWRDNGDSIVEVAVHDMADPGAAAERLAGMLPYDRERFGTVAGEAAVGEGGRLMRIDGTNTIRWRSGPYVARLSSIGPHPLPHKTLAALAASLGPALPQLAGKVTLPDDLARLLPKGDAALPELGATAGPPDWWIWTLDGKGRSVPSRQLRRLLAAAGEGAMRTYAVPALPGHFAMVGVMPFKDAASAGRYMRASVPAAKGDVAVQQPDPARGIFLWRADAVVGRYAVEVDCQSEKGGINPGCEAVVRDLMERTRAILSAER